MRDQLEEKIKLYETLRDIPFISGACAKTGIPRSSVYRWLNEDAVFKKKVRKAIKRGNEMVNDIAYGKLIQKIREGYWPAIVYQLSRGHPDYKDKKNNDVKINIQQKGESTQLSSLIQALHELPLGKLPSGLRKKVVKKWLGLYSMFMKMDEKTYKESGIDLRFKNYSELEWGNLLQEILDSGLSKKKIKKYFKEIKKRRR